MARVEDLVPVDVNAPIGAVIYGRAIRGVGQTFDDAYHFRRVLKNYCIANKRSFVYERNDGDKIAAICTEKGCLWRVYASFHKADRSFGIRRCNLEHSCGSAGLTYRDNPKADANWIANFVKEKVRADPKYTTKNVMNDVKNHFGVEINYRRAWNGREACYTDIHGVEFTSFDRLRWFCAAVKESNPGSVADVEAFPKDGKFRRIFVSFAACMAGFTRGCRPMLFLDGTHIKTKWQGVVLCAVTKDAEGGFLTVAYAGTSNVN